MGTMVRSVITLPGGVEVGFRGFREGGFGGGQGGWSGRGEGGKKSGRGGRGVWGGGGLEMSRGSRGRGRKKMSGGQGD